jgi:hypothetical protein
MNDVPIPFGAAIVTGGITPVDLSTVQLVLLRFEKTSYLGAASTRADSA